MSWLGKQNFSLGLTTQKRGSYGNNAVLNVCHGYDISHGYLTPVTDPASVTELTDTYSFSESGDYVIEFKGAYYTFSQFVSEVNTVYGSGYFGTLELMSRPVVSDKAIIFPTNVALFYYDPLAENSKKKVRYLSFMSPDDYDDDEDYKPTVTKTYNAHEQFFSSSESDWNGTNCSIDKSGNKIVISVDSGVTRTNGFEAYCPIDLSGFTLVDGKLKGWLIYDMRITGDNQTYNSSTMFENGDATISGYEIVISDTHSGSTNEDYVIGVTKLEPKANKWFRCISYVELSSLAYNRISIRNANYYENETDDPIIYLGVGTFGANKWKTLSNMFYQGEEGKGSYKEKFKRSIENTEQTQSSARNLIDNFNNCSSMVDNGWLEELGDESTSNGLTTATLTKPSYDTTSTTYTKYAWISQKGKAILYVDVEPNTYYEFGCVYGYEDKMSIELSKILTNGNEERFLYKYAGSEAASSWQTYFSNPSSGTKKEIFSGNSVQFKVTIASEQWDNTANWYGTWLKRIGTLPFYKTTRVLYDFNEDDLEEDNVEIHNCVKYSYSFCGRNTFNANSKAGTIKDRYKLMISNPSQESDLYADNPFATNSITLTDLPKIEIKTGTEANINDLYHDYWTDVLIYKSIVYGTTDVEEDFTFVGKINKAWRSGDHETERFKANYMTVENSKLKGFVAVDNQPYEDDDDQDTYYDIDEWHAVDPQQETYNDFLKQADCICHLNGRLYCGNLDSNAQPTALAVSNYNENWIFPTSVDEGSQTGTGTQTDNLHAVSNEIVAINSVNDRIILFYDKEILTMYGNDFYSSNGFGVNTLARLNVDKSSIANTIRELIFSDGKDFYITNGGQPTNISHFKIEVKDLSFSSCMFYDNKYYALDTNKIYVYDLLVGGWYTIEKGNIKFLIDDNKQARCLVKVDSNYKVYDLFGTTYSGTKTISTMYQILAEGGEYDVTVNDWTLEATALANVNLDITMFGQGEYITEWKETLPIEDTMFRYNRKVRFDKKVNAIKQTVSYTGSNPPTIFSIGVVRNDTKARN